MEFLLDYKCSNVDFRNKKDNMLRSFTKRFFMSHEFGISNGYATSNQNDKYQNCIFH